MIAAALILGLSACSDDKKRTPPDDDGAVATGAGFTGTRSYKLDPESEAIQLSVYGVKMGSSDESKFRFLMRTLREAGEFSSATEKSSGLEGGVTLCGVFSVTANRTEIYDLIRSLETDPKNTGFSAVSVSSCGN